jgi:hypothetical protein
MWESKVIGDPFILEGFAAEFYLQITRDYLDWLLEFADKISEKSDLDVETGCITLDNASVKQKVYLIDFCLSALLKAEIPPPKLTHILEAIVYLPFAFLIDRIELEIERQEEKKAAQEYIENYFCFTYYRRLTDRAYRRIVLPLDIAFDATLDNSDLHETVEDWQKHYENILSFDYESTNLREWGNRVSSLFYSLVSDDGEDFRLTSIFPQLADTNWVALNLETTDGYWNNKLPSVTAVTEADFQKSVSSIFELDS